MFVEDAMAAITTDPWDNLYKFPSKLKLTSVFSLSSGILKPLNPIGDIKHF